MTTHGEPLEFGERSIVPPTPITAVGTDGEPPQKAAIINLADKKKSKRWKDFFTVLGYQALVSDSAGYIAAYLCSPRGASLRVVLTDSTTTTRMLATERVTTYLIASEEEAANQQFVQSSGAAAVFVESEDGDPFKSEVVFDDPDL